MRVPELSWVAIAVLLGCGDPTGSALQSAPPVSPAIAASPSLNAPSSASAFALSETQIDVGWHDNSSNENGFQVHRSATTAGPFNLVATTPANVATYRDNGLAPGTQFCYQVRAVRVKAGRATYSAFSNTACAQTVEPPPPPPPPPPPLAASGVTATPYDSRVWVSWTDNSTNEDGFLVERSTDGGSVWNLYGIGGPNGDGAYPDAVVEQQVCFRVIAFNAGGNAPPSNIACTTPPAAPTNLTGIPVDAETIEFTWNDNSAAEDGYEVWVTNCIGGCNADGSDDPHMIAELPAGSTRYRAATITLTVWTWVVAKKDGGMSGPSNFVFTIR